MEKVPVFQFLKPIAILLLCSVTSAAALQQEGATPSAHKKATAKSSTQAAKKSTTAKPTTKATSSKPAPKTTAKSAAGKSRTAAKRAAAKPVHPARVIRLKKAFVASAELKPMARQLIEDPAPVAFNAVEGFARRHPDSDAGSLAWLALGYAHLRQKEFPQAIAALEKARPHAGELFDYVLYFEASAQANLGNQPKVAELIKTLNASSDESIFADAEAIDLYATALDSQGHPEEAARYLEAHRTPARAAVELALGKAYLHSGRAEGASVLRHLYYTMPLSDQAETAAALLSAQSYPLDGSYADEKQRGDLLAKSNHWAEAIKSYRRAESIAVGTQLGDVRIALADVLRHTNAGESRRLLRDTVATGEANAERLYLIGELERNDSDDSAVVANLEVLRQSYPASPWFEQALLSAANMALLEKNYDRAIVLFDEAAQRFRTSQRASYNHWKAAWIMYRQGRTNEARRAFEEQVELYSDRPEVTAALYWRARLAESDGDIGMARAWYAKLSERYPNFYYAVLARERLLALSSAAAPVHAQDEILAHIPPRRPTPPEAQQTEPPPNRLRAEKARLLVNAGLFEYAIRELQSEGAGQGPNWMTLMIARIHADDADHKGIQYLKKAVPGYYSYEAPGLPRPYWELLFPRPYWSDLVADAQANQLDPYLVASLIRQESEFNPTVVSHANAYGLMQLLPKVGKQEAHAAHLSGFNNNALLTPRTNLLLGTHYFRKMVDAYNGRVEYALAAYNAGSNRVDQWLADGHFRDVPEFVESIPFTETREYVQAILRNAQVYQRLYPKQ
jgi:soluble lytic murein transglycosylase